MNRWIVKNDDFFGLIFQCPNCLAEHWYEDGKPAKYCTDCKEKLIEEDPEEQEV